MSYKIIQGDNRDTLKTLENNSIDAIVTDPPYGIEFLGKDWDANTGALETYQECFRVLKPGGHIIAFSAARTYHHLAITLEKAGFEIRDQLMWIYSSGFPKSQDIGRQIQKQLGVKEIKERILKQIGGIGNQIERESGINYTDNKQREVIIEEIVCTDPLALKWEGWKSALKPGHEPIALARKPIKDSIVNNIQKWGTGALNISGTKVEDRYPSNVLGELGEYQKYFYCPKVSRKERHIGFVESDMITDNEMLNQMGGYFVDEQGNKTKDKSKMCWTPITSKIYIHGLKHEYEKWCKTNNIKFNNVGNNHPTVKPVALMEYLIKMITPPSGTVLDPFNGSGSTGMAAVGLGFNYIGLELDPNYVDITNKRIAAWITEDEPKEESNTIFDDLFE